VKEGIQGEVWAIKEGKGKSREKGGKSILITHLNVI